MAKEEKQEETADQKIKALWGGLIKEEPPLATALWEQVLGKFRLPETSFKLLQAFSSVDVKAEKVGQILKENPYYEAQLLRCIAAMSKREELPSVEASLVLMGMQNARNFVLAMQVMRTITGSHATWGEDGKPPIQAKDVIKYAITTEETLQEAKIASPDLGFAAGMMYDLFSNLIQADAKADVKKVTELLAQTYQHGMKTGKIAAAFAARMPEIKLGKYAFAAGLIHDLGKPVLAWLEPRYLAFMDQIGKKPLPRSLRFYTERKIGGGFEHAQAGFLLALNYPVFHPIAHAILHHHEPYLYRGGVPGVHQLALLTALASNMASNMKKLEKPDDEIIPKWMSAELSGFKVKPDTLMQVSQAVD